MTFLKLSLYYYSDCNCNYIDIVDLLLNMHFPLVHTLIDQVLVIIKYFRIVLPITSDQLCTCMYPHMQRRHASIM